MKILKMFEEFTSQNLSDRDILYMKAKMKELSELANDILSNYSGNTKFEYNFNNGELEITLVVDDEHKIKDSKVLEILFDPETMMLGTYLGHEEDFRVKSVEEALDIIEKKIYSVLGISEKKNN